VRLKALNPTVSLATVYMALQSSRMWG